MHLSATTSSSPYLPSQAGAPDAPKNSAIPDDFILHAGERNALGFTKLMQLISDPPKNCTPADIIAALDGPLGLTVNDVVSTHVIYGWTALSRAVDTAHPDFELVKALIEHGADVNCIGNPDYVGRTEDNPLRLSTPLAAAVLQDNFDIASLLLNNGADPNLSQGNQRESLLIMAVRSRVRPEMIELLKKHGAKEFNFDCAAEPMLHSFVNAQAYRKAIQETGVHEKGCLAPGGRFRDPPEQLPPTVEPYQESERRTHAAQAIRDEKNDLITAFAKVLASDARARDDHGRTKLMQLIINPPEGVTNSDIIAALDCGLGATVNWAAVTDSNSTGRTALQFAVEHPDGCDVELVKALIKHRADVNCLSVSQLLADDFKYSTPLATAVFRNDAETALLLLKSGADPNLDQSVDGQSLLESALESSKVSPAMIQLLKDHGAEEFTSGRASDRKPRSFPDIAAYFARVCKTGMHDGMSLDEGGRFRKTPAQQSS